ncbi:TIGR02680 family protein [Actinokineospora alba]|uniref:TIGR02680 family protein n=1 Tax=Actinokineospora alba TaxID=504798 RepID=A0A1H0TR29_9PSEU|nr:TIGR02680 family protein [Actinokineospora alba]TDP70658.1 uncharacterized protein (TIGR02680 family) [Actinokineospora alba]SDJ12816.1 TIGR02680 family protein [Actinokineospora alba]SDP56235.1 TIGR02680 family protein [Actinokineospora alba]
MSSSPDSDQWRNEQLAVLLSGAPPIPTSTRFKPLRVGLVGIWQYGNEEFHFHDGRLILNGRNGSGKTKVLEVTSPFLLDANLSARRLDPFGNNARSMRENLLYGGLKHQIGYVWCEYGRITDDGGTEYRTIGAGMRARDTKPGAPESWYFITPLRVGVDFSLYDNSDRPFDEGDLTKQLGESDDTVFTTAEHYKNKLARDLFGLSPQRLHSLVELLIILRRPKLSENLSIERLEEILSNGLPPIDEELVAGLAKNFDDLKRDEEDLKRFEKAQVEVDLFLDSYRTYARRMTKHVTNDVREADKKYRDVLNRGKQAARNLHTTEGAITKADSDMERLGGEQTALRGRIRALETSPEMKSRETLTRLKDEADEAARVAMTAKLNTARVASQLLTVRRELGEAEKRLTSARKEVSAAETHTRDQAKHAGLRQEVESEVDGLHTNTMTAQKNVQSYIGARQAVVSETRRLQREQQEVQVVVNRVQEKHDDLAARRTGAAERVLELESDLDKQVEWLSKAIVSWSGQCVECRLTDEQVTQLIESVNLAGEREAPRLADLIAEHVSHARSGLLERRSLKSAERTTLSRERETVTAQRQHVAAETDPPPPAPLVARRDRAGLPGAPLWRLVDFHREVADDARTGIEAALLGSGLLDAWVTPDGTLVDAESWDAILLPDPARASGLSLTSLLHAVTHETVPEAVVSDVLASIAVVVEDTAGDEVQPWVSPDGRWAIGPVRGRSGQAQASYIGVAAREAARQRRLAELDHQVAELAGLISALDADLQAFDNRLLMLAEEQRSRPTENAVLAVHGELSIARNHDEQLSIELGKSALRLGTVKTTLSRITEVLRAYAAKHLTPTTPSQLDAVSAALRDLEIALERFVAKIGIVLLLAEQHDDLIERADQLAQNRSELAGQFAVAEEHAGKLQAELQERHQLLDVGIQETLTRLEGVQNVLDGSERESKALTTRRQELGEERGSFKHAVETLTAEADRLQGLLQTALAEFRRARDRGFLDLAGASSTDQASDDLAEAARVHSLLSGEQSDEAARNTARNDVDGQFRVLQREIEGPDWRPWGDNDGDLFVVQVTFNHADHSMSALRELIADEIDTRSTFVQAKERKLFSEVLLGSMGEHLRQRRLDADMLVKEMDAQLQKHPTASEMRMSIKWVPAEKAGKRVHDAIKLLDRGKTSFLAEDARDALIEFLGEQVKEARQRAEFGDWKTHLSEALDYRRWSEFKLQVVYHDSPKPVDLTDELHKRKSGGEKASLLQLPMFAAAAAHYAGAAATSPRPIYLDEAFAGIDAEMRASCMGLLTGFDLDFVMASHDEKGFHTTVPGLMTYVLRRDPKIFGVLATPIVWDGTRRYRLEDRSLRSGPPPSILDADEPA